MARMGLPFTKIWKHAKRVALGKILAQFWTQSSKCTSNTFLKNRIHFANVPVSIRKYRPVDPIFPA